MLTELVLIIQQVAFFPLTAIDSLDQNANGQLCFQLKKFLGT